LQKIQKEHAKLEGEAGEVLEKYSESQKKYAEVDKVLCDLKEKRDQIMEAARTCKSEEVDLVNAMEEKTRTLQQIHARIAGWAAKLTESRKEYEELPLIFCKTLEAKRRKKQAGVPTLIWHRWHTCMLCVLHSYSVCSCCESQHNSILRDVWGFGRACE